MAIAKKAFVWSLFAAGGTLTAFVFPALIALFLLIALGLVPEELSFDAVKELLAAWLARLIVFGVPSRTSKVCARN
ncbi:MAG: hypothetical protein SH820_14695 [Xanthomonadales bacterium]|nr:hypothetical protein [Xanthomonadales bacterium]